jgi:hypothetical protein
VVLPNPQSQISESGGQLTTTNRGTLATAVGFYGEGHEPLRISGTVTLNDYLENFDILLRANPENIEEGIHVVLHNAYDPPWGLGIVEIYKSSPGKVLASDDPPFAYGQPYDFVITDTGDNITVSIDGVERLSAATTYAPGDRIAFHSREHVILDNSSSLDYVKIETVPESSTLTLMGVGVLAFAARWSLSRWKGRLKGRRKTRY